MGYIDNIKNYLELVYGYTDVPDEVIEKYVKLIEVELGVSLTHLLNNNVEEAIVLVASSIAYDKKKEETIVKEKIGDYSYEKDKDLVNSIKQTNDIYKRRVMKYYG